MKKPAVSGGLHLFKGSDKEPNDEPKTVSWRETERSVLEYVSTVSQPDDGLQPSGGSA